MIIMAIMIIVARFSLSRSLIDIQQTMYRFLDICKILLSSE